MISRILARLWLFAMSFLFGGFFVLLFAGCQFAESSWNGCESGQWRGWEARKACARLEAQRYHDARP